MQWFFLFMTFDLKTVGIIYHYSNLILNPKSFEQPFQIPTGFILCHLSLSCSFLSEYVFQGYNVARITKTGGSNGR